MTAVVTTTSSAHPFWATTLQDGVDQSPPGVGGWTHFDQMPVAIAYLATDLAMVLLRRRQRLTSPSTPSQIEVHRQRNAELMKRPLSDAKAAGALRHNTSRDVFLVFLMARGAMARAQGAAARAVAAKRALTLALDGLVPPGAWT
jgi:hypothetical protein